MTEFKLALMTGIDIPIPEIQVNVHQPTIKEISYIGEETFFIAMQFLCLNKSSFSQDESVLQTLTNFQVLMTVIHDKSMLDKKQAIQSLLTVMFPDFKSAITPNSILLNNKEQGLIITIDDGTFDIFQTVVKQVLCASSLLSSGSTVYNPQEAKAREIAAKLMKGRQRVAELKGEDRESVLGRYLSILPFAVPGLTIQDATQLTLYQLYDLMERYGLFVGWEIDLKVRLAGGKPDTKADNWMKNIH